MKKTISLLLAFSLLSGYSYFSADTNVTNADEQPSAPSDTVKQTDPVRERYQYLLTKGREEVIKKEPFFEYVPDMIGFEILDVTGDGKEDLILRRKDVSKIYIADPNTNSFDNSLGEFDDNVIFYKNGSVAEKLKDTRGLNGSFQPYSIYRFNQESNKYVFFGSVEAWDRKSNPKDTNGNKYPDNIDTSKAGIVYFLSGDGFDKNTPVDASVYNQWKSEWRNGAESLKLDFKDLTQENINRIDTSVQNIITTPAVTATETNFTTLPETTVTTTAATLPETTVTTTVTTLPETTVTTTVTTLPETTVTTTVTTLPETTVTTTVTTLPETTVTTTVTTLPETTVTTTLPVTTTNPVTSPVTTSEVTTVTTVPDFVNSEYDINNDGMITTADLIKLIQAVLYPDKFHTSLLYADINKDGVVNSADILKMKSLF